MARTPLFRSLQRALADYRRARALGLKLARYQTLKAEHRLRADAGNADPGRRRLLGGAAASLALAMPFQAAQAAPPPPKAAGARVAIIGAGLAGLTAALKLADGGREVAVYEASGRIGGRMFSNSSYWSEGQVSEWTGELIDTAHRTVRKLAHRFGLPMDDLLDGEPAGALPLYYLDGGYYPRATAIADFLPLFERLQRDLAAAPFPTLYTDYSAGAYALDQLSLLDWINTRVPGGVASPMGKLLDLAYATEYGAPSEVQSSLNLIYLLGYQPDPDNFTDFGESDERFHIRGGNQQLPEAIAASLPAGTVRRDHRLLRLARNGNGSYLLDFATAGGTRRETADLVILAAPSAALDEVDFSAAGFSERKRAAMREIGRGVSGKLQLQFDRRYWTEAGPWGRSSGATYADVGYQQTWEVTRSQPGRAGIINFYTTDPVTSRFATRLPFVSLVQRYGLRQQAQLAHFQPGQIQQVVNLA